MAKVDVAIAEYNALRADLLQTRVELQRSFLYTLGITSIVISILGAYFGSQNENFKSDSLEVALMLSAGVFFLISLNYVSHMRHYVSLSKYLFFLSKEIRKIGISKTAELKKIPVIFAWDLWNIRIYSKGLSKIVFFFTWGSQPIFSILFAFISFGLALSIDDSFFYKPLGNEWTINMTNVLLLIAFSIVAIQAIVSLIFSIRELFQFIRVSKNFNNIIIEYT